MGPKRRRVKSADEPVIGYLEPVTLDKREALAEMLANKFAGLCLFASGNGAFEAKVVAHKFNAMKEAGFFRTFLVFGTGKNGSAFRLPVPRAVIGDAGVTVKMSGLRVFAHPWDEDGPVSFVSEMGSMLISNAAKAGLCPISSQKFSYALTNFYDPESEEASSWAVDQYYGLGKLGVRWHSDPAMLDTTISVLQVTADSKDSDWSSCFRVIGDAQTSPLVIKSMPHECFLRSRHRC